MSTLIFCAADKVFMSTFRDCDNIGGLSSPHKFASPFDSPLQPGAINFLSKLNTNSQPSFAFRSAISRLCVMKPTGISDGNPMSNFFKVGIEGTGKLNSLSEGLYFPLHVLLLVTVEKWPLPCKAFITPAQNIWYSTWQNSSHSGSYSIVVVLFKLNNFPISRQHFHAKLVKGIMPLANDFTVLMNLSVCSWSTRFCMNFSSVPSSFNSLITTSHGEICVPEHWEDWFRMIFVFFIVCVDLTTSGTEHCTVKFLCAILFCVLWSFITGLDVTLLSEVGLGECNVADFSLWVIVSGSLAHKDSVSFSAGFTLDEFDIDRLKWYRLDFLLTVKLLLLNFLFLPFDLSILFASCQYASMH